MGHAHGVLDKDTHFIIDPATRAITTSSEKLHVMQFDHNSETLTFEMPRYIEGHDMSLCNRVEAHFLNIDPKTRDQISGHRVLEDFRISEEDVNKVVVSWTITKGATKIGGLLHFILKFKCMEGDVETYAWHTDFFKNYTVKGGLDAAALFESEYVDVIEQWKASVMQHFTDDLAAWKKEAQAEVKAEVSREIAVERERINNIVALKDGSTTGDAELQDVRVGFAGNKHRTAGEAIRSQIENIVENIDEIYRGENINVFWRYANDANKGQVYKNDTGELITTSGNYSHSGYIPVAPGQKVTVYAPEPNGNCITMVGAYFDCDKNLVHGMGYHPNYKSGEPIDVTIPDGVYYMGINYHLDYTKETAVIPHAALPWQLLGNEYAGKVWCCVGDSLTEANGRAEKHYFDYVAEKLGFTVLNYGVSGTGYKNGNFAKRISNITEEFDVMTIMGSFNDLDEEWEIGEVTDSGTNTLCGCMNVAIESFKTKYPTKKIGVITPTPWKLGVEYFGIITTAENMSAYVEALLNVAKRHRVPCLDLYHCSGLNPDNDTVLSEFYCENGTQDIGVHPNSEGHKFMAAAVREFIKTLI